MSTTRRGGNLSLKLDISQAYDIISWEFLYRTMKKLGFSAKLCNWILVLLKSSKISIMPNVGPIGFFGIGRGIKQGDPLSPILFIIVEDVLSRNIQKMVTEQKIQPMVIRNGIHPTYLLFVDDILLFCNGSMRSITNLRYLLVDYQAASGQVINAAKNRYLGVMLVQGKIKSIHLWHLVEYMQSRLTAWSGNAEEQKCVTLKWDKVCSPVEEGGLGIRKLEDMNKALLMKFIWKMLNSQEEWARLFLSKYKYKEDGQWCIPKDLLQFFNAAQLPVIKSGDDLLIWTNSHSGCFTVSDVVKKIRNPMPKLHLYKKIWNAAVLPSVSANVWKITREICPIDENLRKKGFQFASRCFICHHGEDSMNHILWHCNFSKNLWSWLGGIFHFLNPLSFEDVLKLCKHASPIIKDLWIVCSYTFMTELWLLRNEIFYDDEKPDLVKMNNKIKKMAHDCECRMKGTMWGSDTKVVIMQYFLIQPRNLRRFRIIEFFLYLPSGEDILLCCDGASRGNPGTAGYGFIARNQYEDFVIAESGGLGVTTNYVAEFYASIRSMEWAI
ncbi:uncharacterized protein LOC113360085 [Papaver somniferum]|uniref:uncharacterized protein LOC113360085 n=1 Tax=Papaver somniferum TaxID=3469 RepID=UPI000E70578C|nr:uncharacterized protein LOC113360085 [Papaver somniferum]